MVRGRRAACRGDPPRNRGTAKGRCRKRRRCGRTRGGSGEETRETHAAGLSRCDQGTAHPVVERSERARRDGELAFEAPTPPWRVVDGRHDTEGDVRRLVI